MNETLTNILSIIVSLVLIPLISLGSKELIGFIKTKTASEKTRSKLTCITEIVTTAVKAVFQTYVEALKKEGKFTKDAQVTALKMAKQIATEQLNEDLKSFITINYGEFDHWLTCQIEASINTLKNK